MGTPGASFPSTFVLITRNICQHVVEQIKLSSYTNDISGAAAKNHSFETKLIVASDSHRKVCHLLANIRGGK